MKIQAALMSIVILAAAPLVCQEAKPAEKPDCRWRIKAERERMLTRVAQDAERALRAVEQADGLLDDEPVAEAHQLLRELVGQDFDIDDDGVPRLHRGTALGRIISTARPPSSEALRARLLASTLASRRRDARTASVTAMQM